MTFSILRPQSLQTRLTVLSLAVLAASMSLLVYYASRTLREDMQSLLGDKQDSTAAMLAIQFNEELKERFIVLESIAGRISPAMLADSHVLAGFIQARLISGAFFNGGLYVTNAAGTPVVGHALRDSLPDAHDVDAVAAVLRDGRREISRPAECGSLHAPLFDMIVPIRDGQGRVIGAVAGVTHLGEENFLDRIVKTTYGQRGGIVLVSPRDRLVVTATDKRRILEPLPPSGANAMIDRFIGGFEGATVGVNARGEEVLIASRRIPVAGWDVAVSLPTIEAFAPIRAMQQRMLLGLLVAVVLGGILIWRLQTRLLEPMAAATRALAAPRDATGYPDALPVSDSRDEVAQLVGGFNRLIAEHRLTEAKLATLAANLEQQVDERTRQLRAVSAQLTMAEERERHLLAEELHDNLGQLLAAIKIKLSLLDGSSQAPIQGVVALVEQADQVVRMLVSHWNPPILKVLGFMPALEWLCNDLRQLYGLNTRLDAVLCRKPLFDETKSLLFRSVRELLINVAKHAHVDTADLVVRCNGTLLTVVVRDAGGGFDAGQSPDTVSGALNFGLNSIRERIRVLGGAMRIDSGPGRGTAVTVTLPCQVVGPECAIP